MVGVLWPSLIYMLKGLLNYDNNTLVHYLKYRFCRACKQSDQKMINIYLLVSPCSQLMQLFIQPCMVIYLFSICFFPQSVQFSCTLYVVTFREMPKHCRLIHFRLLYMLVSFFENNLSSFLPPFLLEERP